MERKIGEIFEYNGEWYQCVKGGDCNCCDLLENGICVNNFSLTGSCFSHQREDKTCVLFKKLEKVGESIVYMSRTFQRLKLPDTEQCKYCYFKNQVCNPQLCGKETFLVEIKQNKEDMEKYQMHDAKEDIPEFDKVVDECLFGEEKTKLKPFNLEQAKAGKPVCTRDGRKARIICFDRFDRKEANKQIVALVKDDDREFPYYYDLKGRCLSNNNLDLMMLPEKKEGWIVVRRSDIYENEERAKEALLNSHTAMMIRKITWEE